MGKANLSLGFSAIVVVTIHFLVLYNTNYFVDTNHQINLEQIGSGKSLIIKLNRFKKVHPKLKRKNILTQKKSDSIEKAEQSLRNETSIDQSLVQYYRYLAEKIDSNKNYPLIAQRLKHKGIVGLNFKLSPNGKILHKTITKSSQSEYLDNAATEILEKIGQFKAPPNDLKKTKLEFSIDIEYE